MNELTIPLEENSKEPLYQQIYHYMKNEIRKGSLPAGQKLPSTRALAQHLQISRSTVDFAYGQLLSEGYIESVPYKGHFVCEITRLYQQVGLVNEEKEPPKKKSAAFDFSPNGIDITEFPFATWRKISKNVFADEEKNIFEMGAPKGDRRLRETICSYLHSSRGVECTPSQIIVGAGNDYLLMLLQKILGTDRKAAVENPAYMRAARIFASGGYEVAPIGLDESGMRIDKLRESGAQIAYITPSHQFPTGVIMPIGRRMEILAWAKEREDRYIIEDDYDSEFRYKGMPIPSLQGSDKSGKVVYLGTFSKSIAPAIRISYMVLPGELLQVYEEKLWFISSTVSRIDQAILYHFIEDGHFERYLNKMRKVYKGKHDLLMERLRPFQKAFRIRGEYAGLHVLLEDRRGYSEEKLLELAKEADCQVYGMSGYLIGGRENSQDVAPGTMPVVQGAAMPGAMLGAQDTMPGATSVTQGTTPATVIVGYAALTEEQIIEGTERLKKVWQI